MLADPSGQSWAGLRNLFFGLWVGFWVVLAALFREKSCLDQLCFRDFLGRELTSRAFFQEVACVTKVADKLRVST